jgi:hypothetical protein
MNWADQHGVSYLAWGWWVLSPQEIADAGCSAYYLITDPKGTPAVPNGVNLHDHLVALPAGASPTTPSTPSTPTTGTGPGTTQTAPRLRGYSAHVRSDGSASFVVRSDQASSGLIGAKTVGSYALAGKHRRRHVVLGSVGFRLVAGTSKTVVLKLTTSARKLLARQHTLQAQITITLTNVAHRRSISRRTLKLKAPARR